METYKMITLEQASSTSLEQLVKNYNSAIEMIWHLQRKLHEQIMENEQLSEAYEDISNQLYG